jgi:DNA-binding MarR family transcriptional regulator
MTTTHGWTFLTNHTHVLLVIWRQPDIRLREVSAQVGITERATQRIVHELVEAGFLKIEKSGRQNRYSVTAELPLRHPLERDHTVGELLEILSAV